VLRIGDDAVYAASLRLLPKLGVRQFTSDEEWLDWCRRTVPVPGGFLYRRLPYRFQQAFCAWQPGSGLAAKATGTDCALNFAHVPITGVRHVADLEGCDWPPQLPTQGFRRPAPVDFPWAMRAGSRTLKIVSIEIDCGAYNAEPETLNVFFHGEASESSEEPEHTVSGSLCCRIVPMESLATIAEA